jgi:hypothetical protein
VRAALFATAFVPAVLAYVVQTSAFWPDGTVTLQLRLGTSPTYSDGTNPNSTALEALKEWNPYMNRVQLAGNSVSKGTGSSGNGTNDVFFSDKMYNESFGTNVLAVTYYYATSTKRTQSDVIVNTAWTWDSYRGSLQYGKEELRRVLAHEFGHVLGLSHPDENGQYVNAIMNSSESDVEAPITDDQNGVASIYGYGVANPPIPPHIAPYLPYDATVTAGQSINLYVSLNYDDTPPFTYQWRKDGVDIPGATAGQLDIASATLADSGVYNVVVTNAGGAATSRGATVTVNPPQPPTIYSYSPQDTAATVGKSASFYVYLGSGTPPFTYQWRKNGAVIPNATSESLYFNSLTYDDAGLYSVVVTNAAGSATSRSASLIVNAPTLPTVSASLPWYQEIYIGGTVTLYAGVSGGTDPFSYQWEKDGVGIPGATGSWLTLSPLVASDTGDYTVVVTNPAGSVRSAPVALQLQPAPRPNESTIWLSDGSTRLSCNNYDSSYTYQWYRNGQLIAGATGSFYDVPAAWQTVPADYVAVVSGAGGSTPSRAFHYQPASAPPLVGTWIAAERLGNVAYFLFANPARIERYDLGQAKWLSSISLARTPTAFRPDGTGLYVAFGKSVSRFDLEGTSETSIITVDQTVTALFVRSGMLYVFYPDTYVYSKFKSIRLSDNVVLDTKSYIYAMTKAGSLSMAPTTKKIFGRDSGSSPADIHAVDLNDDGTFGEQRDSPYHGDYPDANRTFVSPDEKLVIEDSGVAYHVLDLTYAGALGSSFDDLAFADDGSLVVLQGNHLIACDQKLTETGRLALSSAASRIFVSGQTVAAFTPPSASGQSTTVVRVNFDRFAPRTACPAVSADGLTYTPSDIILGGDNIVYLLSRAHANVFRWSVGESRYLEPLPMFGAPNFIAMSADASILYSAYADQHITQLNTTTGVERLFYSTAQRILGMARAGEYLFFNDAASPWTSYYTVDAAGNLLDRRAWSEQSRSFVWSEVKHRLYHFRDDTSPNDLIFTEINVDGTFGTYKDSPYHGDIATRYPIRVSPNGGTVLLGSGAFFDTDTLTKNNALPTTIDDATWLGTRLYTARETVDGIRIERWGGNNYGLDAAGVISGRLLRLFSLGTDGLLAIVMRDGAPAFVKLDADLTGISPVSPKILTQPEAVQPTVGASVALSVSAMGGGLKYQWRKDDVAIPGATLATFTIDAFSNADVGNYSVVVSNTVGVVSSTTVRLGLAAFAFKGSYTGVLGAAGEGGDFSLLVREDGTAVLLVTLAGAQKAVVAPNLLINADGSFAIGTSGDAIVAATTDSARLYTGRVTGQIDAAGVLTLSIPSLGLTGTAARSSGTGFAGQTGYFPVIPLVQSSGEIYTLVGDGGEVYALEIGTSNVRSTTGQLGTDGTAQLSFTASGTSASETMSGTFGSGTFSGTLGHVDGSTIQLRSGSTTAGVQRLINISARGIAGAGDATMIAGFVVSGSAPKRVLIRAIGPTLTNYGVSGVLADPQIELYKGKTVVDSNDNWTSVDTMREIAITGAKVGAFPLTQNSNDSVVLTTLAPGAYTAHVSTKDNSSGVAIIEVYDAGSFAAYEPKVVNISTRAQISTGDKILIAGFVITGDAPKKVLIRGIGPTLANYGVSGTLADPLVRLYSGSTTIAENDDWDGHDDSALIASAAAKVGAFALAAGSKDAALLLYLKPGIYTAQVRGVNDTTGVGLVEVYEVSD